MLGHRSRSVLPLDTLTLLVLIAALVSGCRGAASATNDPAVTIRTSTPAAVVAETPSATPTPAPARSPTAAPTASGTPRPVAPPKAPEAGRWIDVDVSRYVVRLMDGTRVLREIGPVAVGRQVDTGAYASTQTGLFQVYVKTAPLTFDAPYNTYIQWWVGFDPQKDNGFHSFLLDAQGNVVDAATGRVSNGCIRTGEAQALFEFAEVGMPVFVRA